MSLNNEVAIPSEILLGKEFSATPTSAQLRLAVDHRAIAIDADLFVPPGAPNFDMQYVNLGMFDYVASLLKGGHDLEFIVSDKSEIEAADGFMKFYHSKSGHRFPGVFKVKWQGEIDPHDHFDVLISNRASKFTDIMRAEAIPTTNLNLQSRLVSAVGWDCSKLSA